MPTIKVDDVSIGYRETVSHDSEKSSLMRSPATCDFAGSKYSSSESVESDKMTLVFLHGVGSDKSAWDGQLARFGSSVRAVALDYPGYGESSVPARSLTREEMAGYLLRALRLLGVSRACLVGLSLGGVIAFEMLRQAPGMVAALVLADTFAAHPNGVEIIERTKVALAEMTLEEFARKRVGVLVGEKASADLRCQIVETMARIDPHAYRFASRAVWLADYKEFAGQIEVPTLVMVGEHDVVTPPELSVELRELIPTARLRFVNDAGHLSNLENPVEFNKHLTEFMQGIIVAPQAELSHDLHSPMHRSTPDELATWR